MFDDVDAALLALVRQGLRLGVLTNGTVEQQRAKLERLGLTGRFELVLTAEELGAAKPDPVVYLAACDRFDLRPAHVLHVGELPDIDVVAARAAGLPAVLLDRVGRYGSGGALRSLAELPTVLAALNKNRI